MKIKTADFVPERLHDQKLSIRILNDKIEISGKRLTAGGGLVKSIILPRIIVINENFIEAIGLYVGDGKLTPNDTRHTEFTTIDTDIGKFMLDFFRRRLNVNDMYIRIRYSIGNRKAAKEYWLSALGISGNNIFIKRHLKNRTPAIDYHINSLIFRFVFEKIIRFCLSNIVNIPRLRRAFLRGFFAADGCLETRKTKYNNQINHVSFAYHKTKEAWLRNYIIKLLEMENIDNIRIKTSRNTETASIRVGAWKNFIILWNIRLFDRCRRKKDTFLKAIKNSHIYIKLEKDFHNNFFNMNLTQSKMAKIIERKSTGLICEIIQNKHLIRVEDFDKLLKFTNYTWYEIINNSEYIRIGNSGEYDIDSEFIKLILRNKGLI